MKRRILLALALVLTTASVAGAVPIITGATTIEPGQTVNLTMEGTYAEASGGTAGNSNTPAGGFSSGVFIDISSQPNYAYYSPPIGYWAGSTITGNPSAKTEAMGGRAELIFYYYGASFTAQTNPSWSESTDVDIGPWFTFDVIFSANYSGPTDGSVYMPIDIGWTSDLGGLDLQVIPEPVTIALLGLGGLALLGKRRKYAKGRV